MGPDKRRFRELVALEDGEGTRSRQWRTFTAIACHFGGGTQGRDPFVSRLTRLLEQTTRVTRQGEARTARNCGHGSRCYCGFEGGTGCHSTFVKPLRKVLFKDFGSRGRSSVPRSRVSDPIF